MEALRRLKASAGSGKTHELTRSFLELLAGARPVPYAPSCPVRHGDAPAWGDILAVTFTNRAASEMKERVVRRLKEAALGLSALPPPWTPALADKWVRCIVRQYGNLNIRTIDSLLRQIVSAAAPELGLPPEFTPLYAGAEAWSSCLDALMERARQGDEELRALIRECCRVLFFRSRHKGWLAGEATTRRLAPLLEYGLEHGLKSVSAETLHAALEELVRNYAASAEEMRDILEREKLAAHKQFAAVLAKAPDIGEKLSAYLTKSGLDACLTGASKSAFSPSAGAAYERLCACAGKLAALGGLFRAALEQLPFITLAARLLEEYGAEQSRTGALAAVRIPELARRSMEEEGASALLCRLSSRLSHILIDEFQDTSRAQWEALRPLALEALAQGGSLTWVGDVKQAIYAFRGGDADLFEDLLRDPELSAVAPNPQTFTLPSNWRSREEIVRFNNLLFSLPASPEHALTALEILMPGAPSGILGEAAADLSRTFQGAGQTVPDRAEAKGGFVSLSPIRAENAEELRDTVQEKLEEKLEEIAGRRALGETAVLVRTNSQASSVAAGLMAHGIPVLTENSLLLARHPLVQQSIAFLRLVHNPRDTLAFWEFCTSPLCTGVSGLSSEMLHDWAALREPGDLPAAFRKDFPVVWADYFAPFSSCGLLTPYDLLREFFVAFQVPQRFPAGEAFVRRLLEVAHAAEGQGHASPAAFLDAWEQGSGEEKLPMPEGMDAVRVMTVHKAKGLEFPVVIVPWTQFLLRPENPIDEFAFSAGNGESFSFLAPRRREMGEPYYRALARSARELLHVLYVAFTRASDELHVFLTERSSGKNDACAVLKAWLPLLGIDPDRDHTRGKPRIICAARSAGREKGGAPADEGAEKPLPFDPPMHWLPKLKIRRAELFGDRADGPRISPKLRGILMHRALEFLTPSGTPRSDAESAVDLGAHALRVRLSEQEREDVVSPLAWYAALPEAAAWAEKGSPEHSLLDEESAFQRVDRLVDEGERITVLEYKSGRPTEAHISQLENYLALLASACGKEASGVLIYLDLHERRSVGPVAPGFSQAPGDGA